MRDIIKFSGGRTSAYMTLRLLSEWICEPPNTTILFNNTADEHPATYDFIRKMDRYLRDNFRIGVTCTEFCIDGGSKSFREVAIPELKTDGEVFDEMLRYNKGYLPNQFARCCTRDMKIAVTKQYTGAKGYRPFRPYVGIRADEERRAVSGKKAAPGYERINFPLIGWGVVKEDVEAFFRSFEFDLDLPLPGIQGNCELCMLKGSGKLVAAAQQDILSTGGKIIDRWIRREESRTNPEIGFFGHAKVPKYLKKVLGDQPMSYRAIKAMAVARHKKGLEPIDNAPQGVFECVNCTD